MSKNVQLILAAIGSAVLVGLGPELWKAVFATKPAIEYAVAVYSSGEKNPAVPRATVELTIGSSPPLSHETSPDGVALFHLTAQNAERPARLKITRAGFSKLDRGISVPTSSARESVYLEPEVIQAAGPAEIPRVFSSGPKPSGIGANFSEWYELCSEPPPSGYSIATVQFGLAGDRSCGAWSECQETQRTPELTCWRFRLQGHNEWLPPRPAFSEGILGVTFRRTS